MTAPTDQEVIEELQETATLQAIELQQLRETLASTRESKRMMMAKLARKVEKIDELRGQAVVAEAEHLALVAKCHEAHDAHMEVTELRQLVADVYWVALGTIEHLDEGFCPDGGDAAWRADGCPACGVLTKADRVIGGAA